MKKLISVLIAVALLCAVFVMPSNAASDLKNTRVDVPYLDSAPTVDGYISFDEYAGYDGIHSLSTHSSQFTDDYGLHNQLDNIKDIKFHMGWTEDTLYLAWVIDTNVHVPFPKGTYELEEGYAYATRVSMDWPESEAEQAESLKHMWMFSCLQFTVVPGAPNSEEREYMNTKNYLSAGICEIDDGSLGKAVWTVPVGVDYSEIDGGDWEAAVVRDDIAGTTTYEAAIPAAMCGVEKFEKGVSVGLGYAVAAQEHYYEKGTSMLEWQDSMLGWPALPDNSGVLTFVGGPDAVNEDVIAEELDEGAFAEGAVAFSEISDPSVFGIEIPENIRSTAMKIYDISLVKDGEAVQPNGRVKVSVLAPSGIDADKYRIWYIDEDGNFIDMNAVYEDGYFVFEADCFGYYAVASEKRLRCDVNYDGEVDKKDYAALKRYCFDTMLLDEEGMLAADVNNDGVVDKKDYSALKRYCFGTWVIETIYV